VLFERLIVPEINWKYFPSFAPPDWANYLEDVVEPVPIQFDTKGLRAFLSDPYVFWIFQAMLHIDQTLMLELDYRTYVGADFGNKQEAAWKEVDAIERALRKIWTSDREGLEWSYQF